MRHITAPETAIYAVVGLAYLQKIGVNLNNTDFIKGLGAFFIGLADDKKFGSEEYEVIFNDGKVFSSEYSLLPSGVELGSFEVLDDWRVVLDGEIIGQIKSFPVDVSVSGKINPIGIFIEEDGSIIQYQISSLP